MASNMNEKVVNEAVRRIERLWNDGSLWYMEIKGAIVFLNSAELTSFKRTQAAILRTTGDMSLLFNHLTPAQWTRVLQIVGESQEI